MDPQDAQSQGDPGGGTGLMTEKPQATPAANRGPDSMSMPSTGEQIGRDPERDYKASYDGLNRWVGKEFNTLRDTVTQMGQQLSQVTQLLQAQQQPSPQAKKESAPAPAPGTQSPQETSSGPDVLELALQQKRAERYRDMLLEEYEQATGLPVSQFRSNVQVVPVTQGTDGKLDDSGQRAVIESLVEGLRGIKGEAQKEVLQGHTPGSAPAAPQGTSADQLVNELHEIMELMKDDAFDELTKQEQSDVEGRYFELLAMPDVQDRHEGNLQPSMSMAELSRRVRELTRKVSGFDGQLPAGFA